MMEMLGWMSDMSYNVFIAQGLKFYIELFIGFLIFAYPLKKRKFWLLKLATSIVAGVVLSVIIVYLGAQIFEIYGFKNYAVNILLGLMVISFLLLALFSVLIAGRVCFASSWWEIMFCGVCGYSTQHICYRVNLLVQYYFFYGTDSVWGEVVFFVSVITVYCVIFALFGRRMKGKYNIVIENKRLIVLFAVVLIAMIFFSGMSLIYVGSPSMRGTSMVLVECGLATVICFLAIITMLDSAKNKRIEEENKRIQLLWKADRKQYEVSKQSVEQLNIMFHDMKHQLRGGKRDCDYISDADKYISVYESTYQTGNEVLDVVLSEKSLACFKHNITITCVAEGKCLAGMDTGNIYSLFGNALDNAIECVQKFATEEKKVIDVSVRLNGEMLAIQFENYYESEIIIRNGLPLTSKLDSVNHGYGLKSISNIVAKYCGNIQISTCDNIFSLCILLPYPMQKK